MYSCIVHLDNKIHYDATCGGVNVETTKEELHYLCLCGSEMQSKNNRERQSKTKWHLIIFFMMCIHHKGSEGLS